MEGERIVERDRDQIGVVLLVLFDWEEWEVDFGRELVERTGSLAEVESLA